MPNPQMQPDRSGSIKPAVLAYLRDHGPSTAEGLRSASPAGLESELDEAIRQLESPSPFITLSSNGNYEITVAGRQWLESPRT